MNYILDKFGFEKMPWIMRVYILLFFTCVAKILAPGLTIFNFPPETLDRIVLYLSAKNP
jgi:hypothetical protein